MEKERTPGSVLFVEHAQGFTTPTLNNQNAELVLRDQALNAAQARTALLPARRRPTLAVPAHPQRAGPA